MMEKTKKFQLKNQIDEEIHSLIELIIEINPFQLLGITAAFTLFRDIILTRRSFDRIYETIDYYKDYIFSIVLALKEYKNKDLTPTKFQQVFDIVKKIYSKTMKLYSPDWNKSEGVRFKDELRSLLLYRYLYVRGDAYAKHLLDLNENLIKPHEEFLKNNIGNNYEEILNIFDEILFQIKDRLSECLDHMGRTFPNSKLDEILKYCRPEIFKIDLTQGLNITLIENLSSEFGENEVFLNLKSWYGWPTNNTIIYTNPILKYHGDYYCFFPKFLYIYLRPIVEKWIKDIKPKYHQKFTKSRDLLLEQLTINYFKKILPSCEAYKSVYYETIIEGEKIRAESDGLIFYDNNIFIIEAKANIFRVEARRGGLDKVKNLSKDVLEKAYQQAIRTKKYILETDIPIFYNKEGDKILKKINNKKIYDNIFLINTTIESLGPISTRLNSVKALGLLKEEELMWTVYINDLRVITEILDSPSEFLLYIQRRIKISECPKVITLDELDYFDLFLKTGLFNIDNASEFIGYTLHIKEHPQFDNYLDYLYKIGPKTDKPIFEINEDCRNLVKKLEQTKKLGFSIITVFLLGLSKNRQEKLMKNIKIVRDKCYNTKTDSDLSFAEVGRNLGITIYITLRENLKINNRIDEYIKIKKYQNQMPFWAIIILKVLNPDDYIVDFNIYREPWCFDPIIDQKLRIKESTSKLMSGLPRPKASRNEPCPCGSGKKFKKCCGGIKRD